ncbi:hypothetical protein HDU91_004794 [Kappamyces sp. JEL0680]|nr:hypothetical protein HDU91_004794 [Kappamyces sp. JEL0680]
MSTTLPHFLIEYNRPILGASLLPTALLLLFRFFFSSRSTGPYHRIGTSPPEVRFNGKGLFGLGLFTVFTALIQVLALVLQVLSLSTPQRPLLTAVAASLVTYYLLVALLSHRIHSIENAGEWGHLFFFVSLFCTLALQVAVRLDDLVRIGTAVHIRDSLDGFIVGHLALGFVLLLVVLFWSTRLEDDCVSESERITWERGTSIFSRYTFLWCNPMIAQGQKKPLAQDDLWELSDSDRSSVILAEYRAQRNPKQPIFWRVFSFSWRYLAVQLTGALGTSLFRFSGPFFLYHIVSALQDPTVNRLSIVPYLVGLFLCSSILTVLEGQVYYTGARTGTRSRTVLMDELYSKTLHRVQGVTAVDGESKTEAKDDEQASLGKIVTLMSVDTERIRWFFFSFERILVFLPTTLLIAVGSLFLVLGWSALAGVGATIFLGTLSSFLGRFLIKFEEEQLSNTDARVSVVNEMLQGIRIIKYFAWEPYFSKKIDDAREKELKSMFKVFITFMGFGILGSSSGIIIAICTFYAHVFLFGKTLDAATAFTAIKLLGELKEVMMDLPTEVMDFIQAKVSFDRIAKYLGEKELDKFTYSSSADAREHHVDLPSTQYDPEHSIGFKNKAEFRYYGTGEAIAAVQTAASSEVANAAFTLRNLDIQFPSGRLSVICGPTGSGKTSLLLALLGEMECISGSYHLPKSEEVTVNTATGLTNTVAYVPQTAWLQNATIRDNILFGEPFDAERYDAVIRGCALVKDLETLDGGDLTEIGEKGINMSGGQKQRISLARACYSRAMIVMLDDPLSAVDAPTARYLLHKAILKLLKGRTVILVSHATHLVVPYADWVVSVKNGEVSFQGTSVQIAQSSSDSLFDLDLTREEYVDEEDDESVKASVTAAIGTGTTLVEDEEMASGAVKMSVYTTYMKSAGGAVFFAFVGLGFILTISGQWANDWWLKRWTDSNVVDPVANAIQSFAVDVQAATMDVLSLSTFAPLNATVNALDSSDKPSAVYFMVVYAILGAVYIAIGFIKDFIVLLGGFRASRKLHQDLLHAILYSPLRFFEVTPVGRILNRFSKDIETIDNQTIHSLQFFLWCVFSSLSTLCFIGVLTPIFLISVPVVASVFVYYGQLYLNVTRELKRLESVTKSPIYSQFSETLAGVSSIRAYEAGARFLKSNEDRLNTNNKSYMYMWTANRWLSLRTDFLSYLIVFVSGLAIIFSGLEAGWAALLLNFSFDLTWQVKFVIRMHAQLEMNMNSVERVNEFSAIEQEPPAIIDNHRPPQNWPHQGAIQVRDLSMRYAQDLPDVLKKVNFQVLPHEKVAVVGRTGAGKSTLSLAFFRIIPFSSGSITIDGVNISSIGLHDLRSKITIIPQDPVLFAGTLRSNLDPLEQNDDASIWEALKRVNFMESMQQSPSDASLDTAVLTETRTSTSVSLDMSVTENGNNFSQGQRQLLCLARSLLQRNRIIFLDEATASVDNETDAKIQTTLRREFADCTILCIAHRLRTVADYDKILVLDKGEVLEFGTPLDLMQAKGQFYNMCQESGDYDELHKMATNGFAKQ